MTEHPITTKFRAWWASVADVIKCDVIDPQNLKRRCELSSGHAGNHDFEVALPPIRVRPAGYRIPKDQRVGAWTKRNNGWCIRIAGGFQPGDIVPVRRSDGKIGRVLLGEHLGKGVFLWAGNVDESGSVVEWS